MSMSPLKANNTLKFVGLRQAMIEARLPIRLDANYDGKRQMHVKRPQRKRNK